MFEERLGEGVCDEVLVREDAPLVEAFDPIIDFFNIGDDGNGFEF